MARFKPYNYDQKVLLPVSLDEQLVEGTLEWAIHQIVENYLDLSVFKKKYNNDETGSRAYDPKVLLKVVLFAYSRGINTSRPLERLCRENVVFMALACGHNPDHSTIASFISGMEQEVGSIFTDILMVCQEQGLLKGTHFSLDGVKLSSNASKHKSGTHAELRARHTKLREKVKQMVRDHKRNDRDDDQEDKGTGSGKLEKLEQEVAKIQKFLKNNKPRLGKRGTEVKSNTTDNESALMSTEHGVMQGYNAQAMVDSGRQVVVHAEAYGRSQDHSNLEPMVDGTNEQLQKISKGKATLTGKELSADSGYHNKGALKKCEQEKIDAYIPDTSFRKRDTRFTEQKKKYKKRSDRYTQEDFTYNKEADTYTCPEGKKLKLNARAHKKRQQICRLYRAKERGCRRCPSRGKCLLNKKGKYRTLVIAVGRTEESTPNTRMREKIDTEIGRAKYEKRFGTVEPVFANLRIHKRLDRFTLRGKKKVDIQWKLYCMVHNIEKILHYGKAALCL